jgi:2-oxo-4-hydroxy-4-carboxy-5-ureidoimidazoline decarboxylase
MTAEQAEERLATCCAARSWVARMLAGRPYADVEELLTAGDRAIRELGPDDLADALAAHPRIGQRVAGPPRGPPDRLLRRGGGDLHGR